MSEHDTLLIRQALTLAPYEWYIAYDLAEQAQTAEGREELTRIGSRLRHAEEASLGME